MARAKKAVESETLDKSVLVGMRAWLVGERGCRSPHMCTNGDVHGSRGRDQQLASDVSC